MDASALAQGVLAGTRILATERSNLYANYAQAILSRVGHDTLPSEFLDIAQARAWPGAFHTSGSSTERPFAQFRGQ